MSETGTRLAPTHGGATRRVALNSILQASAYAIGQFGMLVLYAVMAREAGTAAFGDFTSAASLSVLVFIAAFGMDFRVTRLVARGEDGVGEAFWSALLLKFVFGLVLLVLVLAVAVIGPYEDRVVAATGLLGVAMLVELAMLTPHAVFRGLERLRTVAIALVLHRGLLAVVGTVLLLRGAPVGAVAAVWIGTTAVAFAYSMLRLRRESISFLVRISREGLKRVGLDSIGLGLAGVFGAVLSRIDIVILGFFTDSESVGLYGGAYRMVESIQFVTAAISMASFPVLARLTRTTMPTLADGTALTLKAILVATAPITVLYAVYAEPLLTTIYGDGLREAGVVLQLLAPAVVIGAMCGLCGYVLTSQTRQRPVLIAVATATVANIAFNLILIPPLGVEGAAIAMVLAMVVMAVLYFPPAIGVSGRFSALRVSVGPLTASAAMAGVGLALGAGAASVVPALLAYALVLALAERLAYPHDARRAADLLRRRPAVAS